MQHRSRLSFIVAGTYRLRRDFWHLIFNAGESMELTMLSRRDTERLIREPVQPIIRYDDLAVEHIWRATSGHPYLTQLICYRLIQSEHQDERKQRIITIDQVHDVIERILDEDDSFFLRCWQELSPSEQQILTSLAELQGKGEEAIPFQALVPKENDEPTNYAIRNLMQMGMIKEVNPSLSAATGRMNRSKLDKGNSSDGAYRLAFGLLRQWMMKQL
jgi:hypothetical protein